MHRVLGFVVFTVSVEKEWDHKDQDLSYAVSPAGKIESESTKHDLNWRTQTYESINDDVPEEVREIRGKVLVPALKKIKAQQQSAKVTIVGDKLLHDGHFYDHNRIPARWLSTYESDED